MLFRIGLEKDGRAVVLPKFSPQPLNYRGYHQTGDKSSDTPSGVAGYEPEKHHPAYHQHGPTQPLDEGVVVPG